MSIPQIECFISIILLLLQIVLANAKNGKQFLRINSSDPVSIFFFWIFNRIIAIDFHSFVLILLHCFFFISIQIINKRKYHKIYNETTTVAFVFFKDVSQTKFIGLKKFWFFYYYYFSLFLIMFGVMFVKYWLQCVSFELNGMLVGWTEISSSFVISFCKWF